MPVATDLRVNDKVTTTYGKHKGKIFTVVKVMTKNLRVSDDSGNFFKGPPSIFTKYVPGDPLPEPVATGIQFVPGEPVRWKKKKSLVYVVLRQSRETVTIALFGGDEGRTLRVLPDALTRIRPRVGGGSASQPPLAFVSEVGKGTSTAYVPQDFSETFCKLMEGKYEKYKFWVQRGRKYDKIRYQSKEPGGQVFIHCFIGQETHNIFKADSLNKPSPLARFTLRDRRDIERVVALSDLHGTYLYQSP